MVIMANTNRVSMKLTPSQKMTRMTTTKVKLRRWMRLKKKKPRRKKKPKRRKKRSLLAIPFGGDLEELLGVPLEKKSSKLGHPFGG